MALRVNHMENADDVHAQDERRVIQRMIGYKHRLNEARAGSVMWGDDLEVSATPGDVMSVDVSFGAAYVDSTEPTPNWPGGYFVFSENNPETLEVVESDPSNPRHDLVGIQVLNDEFSGAEHTAELVVLEGVADPDPTDPDVPWNFLPLARVVIGPGATAVTDEDVTDLRHFASGLGGINSASTFDEFPAPHWDGMWAWARDEQHLYFSEGLTWNIYGRTFADVVFAQAGNLAVASGEFSYLFNYPTTLNALVAIVDVAPTDADIILDIIKNGGGSIFAGSGSLPHIAAGSTQVAAPYPVDGSPGISGGDALRLDILQVGSSIPGANLAVMLQHYQV